MFSTLHMIGAVRIVTAAVIVSASMLGATTVSAQTAGPWSLSFDLGADVPVSGDVHSGGMGTVLALPTVVEARSYSDIYGPGFYWAAGLGYRVGMNGEVRVQGAFTTNSAENLQVGTVAGLPLFGLWDDYKAFTMDVGYRQYFGTARARPFVGGSVGFARLASVQTEFTVPAAGVVISDVDFFDDSTVPVFGVGAGLQMALSGRVAFQVGFELKHYGSYADLDGLAGTGLESINDDSSRWAMPVTAGLSVRF